MAEFDTGYDHASSGATDRREGTRLEVASHPWAIAGLALAGGVLGALMVKAIVKKLAFTTGDEPPIRVRNGSLKLDLLRRHAEWTSTGPPFGVKGAPTRGRDELVVVILDPLAMCGSNPAPRLVEANKLILIDTDDRRHHVQANGKRINVTPAGATPPPDPADGKDVLKISTAKLKEIEIVTGGGPPMRCTMGASGSEKLLILDW